MQLTPGNIEASLHRHVDAQLAGLSALVRSHPTIPDHAVHNQMRIVMRTVAALTDDVVPPHFGAFASVADAMNAVATDVTHEDLRRAVAQFDTSVRTLLQTAKRLTHNPF